MLFDENYYEKILKYKLEVAQYIINYANQCATKHIQQIIIVNKKII